jgi:hypothetical protein
MCGYADGLGHRLARPEDAHQSGAIVIIYCII